MINQIIIKISFSTFSNKVKIFNEKFKINKKIILIYIIIIINAFLKNKNKENFFIKNEFNFHLKEKYKIFINNNDTIYFNITEIKYFLSIKYKTIKIKYRILFFDKNNNFISLSDLTLFNNLHLICMLKIINENSYINSLPNIYQDKYYECIEFMNVNEKIQIGITIYQTQEKAVKIEYINTFFFLKPEFSFATLKISINEFFEPLILNNQYIRFSRIFTSPKINDAFRLKKTYYSFAVNCLKRDIAIYENIWYFKNLNNIYFCFCKGLFCLRNINYQKCKYKIYLNIIDKNRKVYKKDHYLFLDFVFNEYSSDDVYPVFKKMIKLTYNVHYFTENMGIYNEYCSYKSKCFDIIYINKNNYK